MAKYRVVLHSTEVFNTSTEIQAWIGLHASPVLRLRAQIRCHSGAHLLPCRGCGKQMGGRKLGRMGGKHEAPLVQVHAPIVACSATWPHTRGRMTRRSIVRDRQRCPVVKAKKLLMTRQKMRMRAHF